MIGLTLGLSTVAWTFCIVSIVKVQKTQFSEAVKALIHSLSVACLFISLIYFVVVVLYSYSPVETLANEYSVSLVRYALIIYWLGNEQVPIISTISAFFAVFLDGFVTMGGQYLGDESEATTTLN